MILLALTSALLAAAAPEGASDGERLLALTVVYPPGMPEEAAMISALFLEAERQGFKPANCQLVANSRAALMDILEHGQIHHADKVDPVLSSIILDLTSTGCLGPGESYQRAYIGVINAEGPSYTAYVTFLKLNKQGERDPKQEGSERRLVGRISDKTSTEEPPHGRPWTSLFTDATRRAILGTNHPPVATIKLDQERMPGQRVTARVMVIDSDGDIELLTYSWRCTAILPPELAKHYGLLPAPRPDTGGNVDLFFGIEYLLSPPGLESERIIPCLIPGAFPIRISVTVDDKNGGTASPELVLNIPSSKPWSTMYELSGFNPRNFAESFTVTHSEIMGLLNWGGTLIYTEGLVGLSYLRGGKFAMLTPSDDKPPGYHSLGIQVELRTGLAQGLGIYFGSGTYFQFTPAQIYHPPEAAEPISIGCGSSWTTPLRERGNGGRLASLAIARGMSRGDLWFPENP